MKKIFNITQILIIIFSISIFGQQKSNFTNVEISGTLEVNGAIELDGATELNGLLTLPSGIVCGQNAFTTTAIADTVVVSGALTTDLYFVNGIGGSVDQQDVLQVEAKAGSFIVHRLASGASALAYNWLRIRTN